jgi:LAO/AO transport system kinase
MRGEQLSVSQYLEGLTSGSTVVLGRAITLIESQLESDRKKASTLLETILPFSGKSTRIAISGVPGVGKSTFIEAFGKSLTSAGRKVAVLAIDPTSVKTRGSILGDKTRMDELSKDPNAYVRPTAAGGHLGGVGGRTREAILVCECAGFDTIIVETVGVGQSEISVRGMVDFVLLLMLSGAGDELQGIKKGIIEIADGIAINKADGDNVASANRAKSELQHALHLLSNKSDWTPKVVTCSALSKTGLDEIWRLIESFKELKQGSGEWQRTRSEQQILWMRESLNELIFSVANSSADIDDIKNGLEQKAAAFDLYPPSAAAKLWSELLKLLRR